MDDFRSVLLSIHGEILNDDLVSIKFMCKQHIGSAALEKIKSSLELFQELEKRNKLGPENRSFLADIFVKVGREDLKNKLLGIRVVPVPSGRAVPNAPLVTGNLEESHLFNIAEDLGRDWKRLARKLGIKETIIDNIDIDHKKVKEKSYQALLRWLRQNGVNATGQVLADTLTLINRRDIAELLADNCNAVVPTQKIAGLPIAENVKNRGPLDAMPDNLRANLPIEESRKSIKDEKDSPAIEEADSAGPCTTGTITQSTAPMPSADNPSDARPPLNKPTQEELVHKELAIQPVIGIVDPARYFNIKKIGHGSCGMVYMCKTKDANPRTYAVKQVLLGMNDKETQKQVKILKKEIEILKKLTHEYIVKLYYAEDTRDALSIFMEYVPKGSIRDHLVETGKPLDEPIVRKYTYQILKGCEYLHQNNIIHRDIKGANVLIDEKGNIRLADFGISSDLEKVMTVTTGSFRGTVCWSSPEFVNGEDPAFYFDIWSVGCTVIEMLTGKPPNHEVTSTQAVAKIMKGEVKVPNHLSELAKTFLHLCFAPKEERPTATALLQNEFPTKNASDDGQV